MTNVTNELLLEVLKAIQADLASLKAAHYTTNQRLSTMEQHIAALVSATATQNAASAEVDLRIERIEKRLNLVDIQPL